MNGVATTVATITNQSNKTAVGYVVMAEYADNVGTRVGRRVQTVVPFHFGGAQGGRVLPGASWQIDFRGTPSGQDGALAKVNLSIDFILFEDGSKWGPDTQKGSLKIEGVMQGWASAFTYLDRLLKESGSEKVINTIRERPRLY